MTTVLFQQQIPIIAGYPVSRPVPIANPPAALRVLFPADPLDPWTREQLIALTTMKADEHNLVPWEFLGLIMAEKLDARASRPVAQEDWRSYWEPPYPTFDVSMGLGQRSIRYSDEYAAWCRAHGINPESPAADAYPGDDVIASIRDAYFNPYHALDVAALEYRYWRYNPEVPYLTAACAYNLPGSYHAPEGNPNYKNYRDSGIEARSILGLDGVAAGVPALSERVFGIDVPDIEIRQRNNWTCSVRSVYAGLWQMAQLGLIAPVTYGDGGPRDVYDWMVPSYASEAGGGLHYATGAGMAEMLRSHGLGSSNQYPSTLADVQARAGLQPVMIGGKAWNHWSYVRGVESDGTLILENPSPGWAGIYDRLRDSIARLGDQDGHVSMVWIDVP